MKKYLLVCFFLVSLFAKGQQPFCPAGAVWHYDWSMIGGGGFIKIEYASDTVIEGITCKKLQPVKYTFYSLTNYHIDSLHPEYIYQNVDTVFWYTRNRFFVLFNFGAIAGDEWVLTDSSDWQRCRDSVSVLYVDSVGSTIINGETLKWISVHHSINSHFGYRGKIFERIGPVQNSYLFPYLNCCDTMAVVDVPTYNYQCYEDNAFALYHPQTEDCEYLLHLDVSEIQNQNQITISPNPFTNEIKINGATKEEVVLYDVTGKEILRVAGAENFLPQQETKLNTTKIAAGFYLLRVGGKVFKVVKGN